jgi:hypothetical protein
MKKRKKSLFLGAVASLMLLGACNDFLTGQDGAPTGPLKVVRLTLIDFGVNTGHLVFTDTSVPSDCTLPQYKDLKQCTNDPFMDTYGVKKSPPNPDSLRRLRVVFNKPPLQDLDAPSRGVNSTELELVPESGVPSDLMLVDQKVIGLSCTNCSTDNGAVGVPLTYNSLQLTGSDLSPDPSQFPYGPGLQMEVLTSCSSAANKFKCDKIGLTSKNVDPLAALEPDASYTVTLSKGLSGRDNERILIDDHATALLSFRTEPLQINTVGNGDGEHSAEVRRGASGTGTASDPYMLADGLVPLDGAIEIATNAPIDYSRLNGTSATAEVSVNGGAPKAVAVTVSPNVGGDCGNLRSIYVAPVAGAKWATPTNSMTDEVVVTVTLKGAAVYDLSQVKGHPIGKGIHTMGKDLVIRAKLLKGSAAMDYAGALSSAIQDPNNC